MKRYIVLIVLIYSSIASCAQSPDEIFASDDFEKRVLSYVPNHRMGVSDADFRKGAFILDETRQAVHNTPDSFNVADYWNITIAFLALKEPKRNIETVFTKAIEADPKTICAYLKISKTDFGLVIPELFYPFYKSCQSSTTPSASFDFEAYATQHKIDTSLLRLIHSIS